MLVSNLDDDSVPALYQCLRATGRVERLDLVLATKGGTVTVARRLAMLLREFSECLTVVVPHEARSAGTLLCLGADDLLLGPLAELSPIDPTLSSSWPSPPDGTDQLSAEDIRAFPAMAEEWFGVTGEEDRLQMLALVAQRVFPGSLAALYRYERLCRRSAAELLRRQLPAAAEDIRQRLVDRPPADLPRACPATAPARTGAKASPRQPTSGSWTLRTSSWAGLSWSCGTT